MPKSALARFLLKGQSICKSYAKMQGYAKSGPKQSACKSYAKSAAMQMSCQKQPLAIIMPKRKHMQKSGQKLRYAKSMPKRQLMQKACQRASLCKRHAKLAPCKIHASKLKAKPAASPKSPQAKAARGHPPSGECSPLHKCLLRTNQFFRLYQADSAKIFGF